MAKGYITRQSLERDNLKPKPVRKEGHLLGFKCPKCDFTILSAGGPYGHGRAQIDVNYHIATTHRELPPTSDRVKAWR